MNQPRCSGHLPGFARQALLNSCADLPPFSAGHEASANHPGVLAGWMSHNFESGHNQWVIDDAPGPP